MLLVQYVQSAPMHFFAIGYVLFIFGVLAILLPPRPRATVVASVCVMLVYLLCVHAFGLFVYYNGAHSPGSGFVTRYYVDGSFEVNATNSYRYWVQPRDTVHVEIGGHPLDRATPTRAMPFALYVWNSDIEHGTLTKYE